MIKMNKDIKEKLEELKDSIDYPKIDETDEEEIDNDKLFSPSDCKVLLDYIEQLKTRQSIVEEKYKIVDEINQEYKEIIYKAIAKVDILRKAYKRNISTIPCTEIEDIDEVLKEAKND